MEYGSTVEKLAGQIQTILSQINRQSAHSIKASIDSKGVRNLSNEKQDTVDDIMSPSGITDQQRRISEQMSEKE